MKGSPASSSYVGPIIPARMAFGWSLDTESQVPWWELKLIVQLDLAMSFGNIVPL